MKQLVKCAATVAGVLALTVCVAPSAHAEGDVSVGYQYGYLSGGGDGTSFPYGFNVDASAPVAKNLAVVGEFGGLYKSESGVTAHLYSYEGGVRYVVPAGSPTVTPFVQVLAGGVTAGASGSNANAFAIQFGGGVNVKATDALKVRLGVDYRRDMFSDSNGGGQNDIRAVIGVVFPFGK